MNKSGVGQNLNPGPFWLWDYDISQSCHSTTELRSAGLSGQLINLQGSHNISFSLFLISLSKTKSNIKVSLLEHNKGWLPNKVQFSFLLFVTPYNLGMFSKISLSKFKIWWSSNFFDSEFIFNSFQIMFALLFGV